MYIINEAKLSYAPIGRALVDTYSTMFSSTASSIVKSVKTKVREVFRAKFGDSKEFSDNVEKLIKATFNTTNFTIKQLPVNQNPTSGKYEACEIVFTENVSFTEGNVPYLINKGYNFYITNVDVVIQNKELTPQFLGIIGTFSREELLKTVVSSVSSSVSNPIAQKLLIYLCRKIDAMTTKNEVDLQDLLNGSHYDKLSFTVSDLKPVDDDELSQQDFANIEEDSIAAIKNDFGEILGGIFLLNYIKGAKYVEYSNNIAEPLIDYKLTIDDITYGISAKAGKTYNGHKPASTIVFQKMEEFINGGEVTDPNGNTITMKTLLDTSEYTNVGNIDPQTLMTALAESNKQTKKRIRNQSIMLIGMFCDNNLQRKICDTFGVSYGQNTPFEGFNSITDEEFANKFDKLIENNKNALINIVNEILEKTDRKTKKNISTMSNEELKDLMPQQKIGMFLYPLTAYSVDEINKNFGKASKNKSDFISSFIRLAFDNKQLYTDLILNKKQGKFTIDFKCVSMDTGNWKFYYGGSSNEPYQTSLAIQMY